jgi:ABC-type amino acid transport substrate-binding protein
MKIVDFSSVVFADSTGVLVKSGKELFTFDNMVGKNIGVIAGTTNARAVRDQLARRNLSATLVEFRDRREGIAALARGDLDGFASDKFVLLALARAENRFNESRHGGRQGSFNESRYGGRLRHFKKAMSDRSPD